MIHVDHIFFMIFPCPGSRDICFPVRIPLYVVFLLYWVPICEQPKFQPSHKLSGVCTNIGSDPRPHQKGYFYPTRILFFQGPFREGNMSKSPSLDPLIVVVTVNWTSTKLPNNDMFVISEGLKKYMIL